MWLLQTPIRPFQPLSLQDVLWIISNLIACICLPTLSREVHMHDVVHSFPPGRCPLIASCMPRRHLREVRSHTHALEWHSACSSACVAEDHAAPPECFPTEGGCFTYGHLLPFRLPQVPCSPQAQGIAPKSLILGSLVSS
jgi:hypothetical protein